MKQNKTPMKLLPFQRRIAATVVRRFNGRALIALEMGLGKTPLALTILRHYNQWPCVVVVPSSLRLNWKHEALSWTTLSEDEILVVKSGKDKLHGKLIIISYDLASRRALELALLSPYTVILDESHYVKNRKAQRTKQLVPLCRRSPRCLLLSGSPVLNRPIELWTQLECLNFSLGSVFDFARRFCNAHRTRFGWDFNGASNIKLLNRILTSNVMVRVLKDDVLTELPPKRRTRLTVQGVGKPAAYNDLVRLCRSALLAKGSVEAALASLRSRSAQLTQCVFKAYAELAQMKAKSASEVAVELAQDQPLVIFGHHKFMLKSISASLSEANISTAIFDGDTPLSTRQQLVDDFQTGKLHTLVLSLAAGGVGITLTRASHMLITELPWSPSIALQAEDRLHRISQQSPVLIRYLVAEKTLDEAIWRALGRKSAVAAAVLDNSSESEFRSVSDTTLGDYWFVVEQILHQLFLEESNDSKTTTHVA